MPVESGPTVVAHGPAGDVRALIRYADARVDTIDDASCRVHIRSESRPWLTTVVSLLATEYDVAVEEPADLLADVRRVATRLRSAATRSATSARPA
jgi:hypothetical protein